MTHTPPPPRGTPPPTRRSGGPSAVWFILAGLVAAIILYFLFFTGTPEDATVSGTGAEVAVEPADGADPPSSAPGTPPAE